MASAAPRANRSSAGSAPGSRATRPGCRSASSRARSIASGSPRGTMTVTTSKGASRSRAPRSASAVSRASGPVVRSSVRGPTASEQRRASARRHSALCESVAAENGAGSAGSVAGSLGGSSQPNRTLTKGSSDAREASPGSDSVARAALGLGATIAWAPRQPSATSECAAESSPSSSGPRISDSCAVRRPGAAGGEHEQPGGGRRRRERGGRGLAPTDGDLGRDQLVRGQRAGGAGQDGHRFGSRREGRRGQNQELGLAEGGAPFVKDELPRRPAHGRADGPQPSRQSRHPAGNLDGGEGEDGRPVAERHQRPAEAARPDRTRPLAERRDGLGYQQKVSSGQKTTR